MAIFRGGVGHSLVIDPRGRLWRARSYEDFYTTYRLTGTAYEIDTCYYANGTSCQGSDCPKYNNCNGSEVRCYYQRTICCV